MDGHAPDEIHNAFQDETQSFDYVRREEMIPMRDGVKLHTIYYDSAERRNACRSC